ncbi:MAG: HAMP domain-containing sensor histidine kinase [Planctomycetota bacterium]
MTKSESDFSSSESAEPLEAALAAHDIKNLLGVVIGNADLQLQAARKNPDAVTPSRTQDLCSSLDAIRLSAAHAMNLCEEMLALADGRPPQNMPVDLAKLAVEAVDLFQARADGAATVSFAGPDTLSVHGQRVDLQRTLLNLMWNAFEAMDGASERKLFIRWGESEDGAFVEIVDSGPGLPQGHLADLTRPFLSSKGGEGKVRGLGLHSAARVMRRHGGRLLGSNRKSAQGAILTMQFGLAPELNFDALPEILPTAEQKSSS